jgi:acetyl-CoA carboxylase carboxyltransferase component
VSTVLASEERAGTLTDERRAQVLHDYIEDARARYAAIDGRIDDIIAPARTRAFLARQLTVFARRGPAGRRGPRGQIDL